jgi:hypothetical protein
VTEPAKEDVNVLLEAARVPRVVIAGAISLAGCGLFVALVGLQNLWLVNWLGVYRFIPYVLLAIGATAVFVAAKQHRARAWALGGGMALGVLLTLTTIVFFAFSFLSGVFSLLGMVTVPAAIATLVIQAVAMRPFRQLVDVRRRLRQSGFDLDL